MRVAEHLTARRRSSQAAAMAHATVLHDLPRCSGSGDDRNTAVGRGRRPPVGRLPTTTCRPGPTGPRMSGHRGRYFALGGGVDNLGALTWACPWPPRSGGRSRRRGRHLGRRAQQRLPCRVSRPVGDRAARESWASISRRDFLPMSVAGVVAALLGRCSSLSEPFGYAS
jgi:hypothetical protein